MGLDLILVRRLAAAFGALLLATPLSAQSPSTHSDLDKIRSLGPWPPATVRDSSNRVSGNPLAIELGRQLFFDPRMSPIGYIACVTCHQPDRAFADLKPRAHGLADLDRNTIALANLGSLPWYGWIGASDSLWMASLRPILDDREFNGSADSVVRLFRRDEELARCYKRVFGVPATVDPERTMVNVAKSLAAYVETLSTQRTPFDRYRDAVVRNADDPGYPAAASRGLRLFVGKAQCVSCHSGPRFSDGAFHAVGSPASKVPGVGDRGRDEGMRLVLESRFNRHGPHNDDRSRRVSMQATPAATTPPPGLFRTPSLRNVAVTAPYMHNGEIETLEGAIRAHRIDAIKSPVATGAAALSPADVDDLVAFLRTLTDADGERRPRPLPSVRCP